MLFRGGDAPPAAFGRYAGKQTGRIGNRQLDETDSMVPPRTPERQRLLSLDRTEALAAQRYASTRQTGAPGPTASSRPHRPGGISRQRRALTWGLGVAAIALAVVFFANRAGLVNLDGVRAGVLSHVAGVCPDRANAYTFLGKHYSSAGRPEEAVNACEKLVRISPEDPQAHVLLGNAYDAASQPNVAADCYVKALELDPNCYEAHIGLGKVRSIRGDYAGALKSYEQAVKLRPDAAGAYVCLGMVFSNLGRYEEAMQAFKQARELDPQISETQIRSGKACLDAGQYEEAITCFKSVVLCDQGHAQAHFNLGRAYLRAGDKALAIEEQRILQELNPALADHLLDMIQE